MKGTKRVRLPKEEEERINKILQKSKDKAEGKLDMDSLTITEDNPDGCELKSNLENSHEKNVEMAKFYFAHGQWTVVLKCYLTHSILTAKQFFPRF